MQLCVLPVCDTKTLCGTWPLAMLTGLTALSPLACRPSGVLAAGLRRSVTGHVATSSLPACQHDMRCRWNHERFRSTAGSRRSRPPGASPGAPDRPWQQSRCRLVRRRDTRGDPWRWPLTDRHRRDLHVISVQARVPHDSVEPFGVPAAEGLHKGEATRDVPGHPTDADRGPPTRLHERADALAHVTPARPPGPLA